MSFSKFDHLRHRPFLVIDTMIHPPSGLHTERKGWRKHQISTEHPRVLGRISHTTMRTATVIIDLWHDRMIKNRHSVDAIMFDDEALAHYKAKYPHLIQQYVPA